MEQNATTQSRAGKGFLVVQVTTANTAIPLQGAAVRVSRDETAEGAILFELTTGADGRTPRVALEAPPRSDTLAPTGAKVFSTYNIEVSMPGYEPTVYNHVPIFDGITAIQQANLVPLPEAGYPDGFSRNAPRLFDDEADFGL